MNVRWFDPNAPRDPSDDRETDRVDSWWTAAAASVVILASYLFRLPPLLNARSTNSDAAVVGLQAMHVLRGEVSPFLWGSGYQTSADALVAAAVFALAGPTPLALMLSALTLHVLATVLVFATLRRRFPPWTTFLLTLPLVLSPASVHTYALYPPRQLSITLAVAAFWAIHGASRSTGVRAQLWVALGAALYGFAISADPYPIVLAPVVLAYALLVSWGHPMRRVPALGIGVLAGLVPFMLIRRLAGATSGQLGLSPRVIAHNWDLLVRECLPWALSYRVYGARTAMDYRPWSAPVPIEIIQLVGAMSVGAVVLIALVSVRSAAIPRSTRQIGFAAALAYPVTIGAFLVSVMVVDHFSMRYLAVLTIMLPFAAAPVAQRFGGRWFAILIAPHLVASAICGWIGYGPFVDGPRIVAEMPELRDDYALFELLRARGIAHAQADYWASYRLTLLWREQIVVVPTNPAEDRYPPYRRAFEAAPAFAYIFDPGRSRENLADAERRLAEENAKVERTTAGGHTVILVIRR
jgi:hypothetical protein